MIALSILISLSAVVAVVGLFVRHERDRRVAYLREKTLTTTLPNRLQAYERLTLYLERIRPDKIVEREQMRVSTANDLYALITNAVKQEFEHNVAMQIYISSASWSRILRAKDEVLKMMRDIAKETDPKSSSLEMARRVLEDAPNKCNFYIRRALDGLRSDVNAEFTRE